MNRVVGRGALIVFLSVAVAVPAKPNSWDTLGKEIVTGIVVTSVAVGVVTTLLILHYKAKERTMTGCIHSAGNALSITDERDQRTYSLAGHLDGVKAGNRVTVKGKQRGSALVFRVHKMTGEPGACRP